MADIQDLLRIGAINPNGGAGGNGGLLFLPNVDFSKGFSLQGITPLAVVNNPPQTPIANFLTNAPGNKPGQQNFLHKLAASLREDFSKMAQNAGVMYSGPVTNGSPVSSGLPAASGGGIELG